MASYLDFEGKYDADRRFVVTNWLPEAHLSFWDSKPINIVAGGMYECEHAIAFKLTKEIVDKAMFAIAQDAFKNAGGDNAYAQKMLERAEMAILNRDMRKPYEDKTLAELKTGEENPIMAKMRAEIRAEEVARLSNEVAATKAPKAPSEPVAVIPEVHIPVPTVEPIVSRRPRRAAGEFDDGAKTT